MRYRLLLSLWLLSDLILFLKIYALSYVLRVGFILSTDLPLDRYMIATALAAPLWLAVLLTTRAFALTRDQASLRNGAYLTFAAIVGVASFTLVHYFLYAAFSSRLLLVYAFLLTALGSWAWHIIFNAILRRMVRRDPPSFPTLIVGVTRESRALIRTLNQTISPLKPVAVLDGRGVSDKEIDGVPVLGKLNKLEDVIHAHKITHLIQGSDLEQTLNLLSACRRAGITYMLLPSVLGIVEGGERVEPLAGMPMTIVSSDPKWMWFFR